MNDLSIMEQLCFSTTRIEASDNNGNICSGTGFFFKLQLNSERCIPLLVTNKHVVGNGNLCHGKFLLTEADENGNPIPTKHFSIMIDDNLSHQFIPHPNNNIDLCVLPLQPIFESCKKINKRLFYRMLDSLIIPSAADIEQLDAVENITMIGYPNGLWDAVNNMPLIRRGTTATHIKYDYNGRSEFVIDAACFPGSSGSPILIVDKGGYTDKRGNLNWGHARLFFIGVLYSGPQLTVTGDIRVINTPNVQKPIAISSIPNNLGYIIKSQRLLDFKAIFNQMM
jgi:hypothetical protein